MATCVVFALAVADGLVPVAGAAPYDVLSRQLARLLVARLNGHGGRGARFFPFLGPVDGQRGFLRTTEPLDPAVLVQLHKQGDVLVLCDGVLRAGTLLWRIIDGRRGEVVQTVEVPFAPVRPFEALARIEFELGDRLGFSGRPQPWSRLTGEALAWALVLRDELLRREANMQVAVADPLRAARRCVELAPGDPEVQDLVGDFAAQLLKRGERRAELAQLLAELAPHLGDTVAKLERIDALLQAAGDEAMAATVACRLARLQPERAEAVERAAARAFRLGRYDDVRSVVELARERGVASPAALAQWAAACDRADDHAMRAQLVRELVGIDDLPVPVARLVVSFLLEEEQPALAARIVERALQKEPDHAMLHFELGRACLQLQDGVRGAPALSRALQLGLSAPLAMQARRFLRLLTVPGLWETTQAIERAIAAAELDVALETARALVRRAGQVAEAWYLLGVVQHKLGRLRLAERVLRRAVRHDGDSADAHNRLGILLVASGRVEEGHRHLVRAHGLAPTDPSPLLHLAQACALMGRGEEAAAHVVAAERCGADPQMANAVRREIVGPA